jgi:hypothetical protein
MAANYPTCLAKGQPAAGSSPVRFSQCKMLRFAAKCSGSRAFPV